MEFQFWQVILLTLYAGYQIWDELHINSSAGSAVFAGFFTGLVMGDMTTGLLIGGAMQLTILGVGTFGGASRIDANSGTVLATAFSIAVGMDPQQAVAALAVPVASLMIQLDVLARFANTFFAHKIDANIEDHNYKAIERNYLFGNISWMLSRALPVFLALSFGSGVVESIVSVLNNQLAWLGTGLTVAGAVLPAVGFAILLRYLPVKKHFPYLILGFVITTILATVFINVQTIGGGLMELVPDLEGTFNSLPMLAVALIGFALAVISYNNNSQYKNANTNTSSQEQSIEGEIEDDEL